MSTFRLLLIASLLLLAACGGGPVKRVFPPALSIQEMRAQDDGSWNVQLRLQNYSNVGTRFASVQVRLEIDGNPAGELRWDEGIDVPASNADLLSLTLRPQPAAAAVLQATVRGERASLAYLLVGEVIAREPSGRYRIDFTSRLSPVPGLGGVLR